MANPIGQAPPNSVSQTLPKQDLNEEYLLVFNSLNLLEQLDLIRRLNASAEFIKESARYNEAVNSRSRSGSLKRSHRDLNSGNGNINSNNSDNHVNRGCARSQGQGQGAPQLPSPNKVAQTTPNSVPQTMSNSVPQTMHPDCTPIAVLETTNSAPEANTLAPEPNTLAHTHPSTIRMARMEDDS
jgi:hypothetical protein